MTKTKNVIYFILSLFLLTGCDFMDCDESDNYTEEEVLESPSRVKRMVTNIYGYLQHDFCSIDGAMLDAATDDAIHIYESSEVQRFVNGTWSPNYLVDDQWAHYYEGIRAANLYLADTDGLTFDDWKYANNNTLDYEAFMKSFENYKYEVRFLRAYFYFELIKRYRNVPFLTEVLYSQEEANELEPTSCEDIANFIISECTELSTLLPVNYSTFNPNERGRITRAAALALKSRVTLYMASPLYAGTTASEEKWRTAAAAAYELIGHATEYGCSLGRYADLFTETNYLQPEVILCRPAGEIGTFEQANYPIGVEGGNTTTCPTQNLVDAYERTDGSAFDWNDPAQAANPYADRDPRLGMTIVYNNMNWPQNSPVEIWEGGTNGLPIQYATTTGYYLRKYMDPSVSFSTSSEVTATNHNWILFRYAEVLLNYAEAMINAFHNPDYTDGEFPLSAREAVNQVRRRSDVNQPALPSNISESEFLAKVKNERRVELAFEGHRFWDLRRWHELDQTSHIYGVHITRNGDNNFTYEPFLMKERTIEEKLYFYPIANTELFKNNNLVQNTGW